MTISYVHVLCKVMRSTYIRLMKVPIMYELYIVNLIKSQLNYLLFVNSFDKNRILLHHNPVDNPLNITDVQLKPSHVYMFKAIVYIGLYHLFTRLTWV